MIIDNNPSIEEKVYAILEEEILTGALPSGTVLRESALAARFEASRTPVRAALTRLADNGLIELMANKGATVIGVTPEDIEDIYAMRMRLEGLAARLAATRMGEDDKRELSELLDLYEYYIGRRDCDKRSELDSQFHRIIFEASGSRYLSKILTDLHRRIKAYRRHSLSSHDRAEMALVEHKGILKAIEMGDGDEAERLTEIHLNAALDSIKKQINGEYANKG